MQGLGRLQHSKASDLPTAPPEGPHLPSRWHTRMALHSAVQDIKARHTLTCRAAGVAVLPDFGSQGVVVLDLLSIPAALAVLVLVCAAVCGRAHPLLVAARALGGVVPYGGRHHRAARRAQVRRGWGMVHKLSGGGSQPHRHAHFTRYSPHRRTCLCSRGLMLGPFNSERVCLFLPQEACTSKGQSHHAWPQLYAGRLRGRVRLVPIMGFQRSDLSQVCLGLIFLN